MKLKRTLSLLLLMIYMLTFTGCWDGRELDTLSIVAGVGIDAAPGEDEYAFTVEIGKAQKSKSDGEGSAQSDPFLILTTTNKTMRLALAEFRLKNSRELFLHPNQVVIFGKDLARQGIGPIFDMFMRDAESRLEVWVLVADGTAKDILSTETKQEPITAAAIARLMENASGISKSYTTKMIDLVSRLAGKGSSSIVPIISKVEEPSSTSLSLSGSALFDNDKMVGQLNIDETKGYIFAMGDVQDGILEVPMEKGRAVLEISELSSRHSPVLSGDEVTIELEINALLAMGELQGFDGLNMKELFPQIEQAAKVEILNKIITTFRKTQLLKTDIFGYGNSIYRKYPKEWNNMKDDWNNIYSRITLVLTVKAQLLNTGLIVDSLDMQGAK